MDPEPRSSKALIGLLLVACLTVLTLDARAQRNASPIDPLRTAVGAVLGPVEDGAAAAFAPLTAIPDYLGNVKALRQRNQRLKAANDAVIQRLRRTQADQLRNVQVAGIARLAERAHVTVAAAQVVAMGPAQSFSRTVTIDAGTRQGVRPDLTVLNADGLVGRVVSATGATATVLLIVDAGSTVGGRLTRSRELGFLEGNGDISAASSLEFSLVDHVVSPRVGDLVETWGSQRGAPYVPGVPIGTVTSVLTSPADLTETATVAPFVDFSSLDVVAVVTASSRAGTVQAQAAR